MANLPAFCDNCGAVFPSGFGGSGSQMIMIGNKSGPCPECGGMGSVPDGHYSLEEALVRFLSGPQSSFEKLSTIAAKISEMQARKASNDEILHEVGKISPGLGWIGGYLGRVNAAGFFTAILTTATFLQNCSQPAQIEDAVRRGVTAGLHQYEQQRLTPAPAEPTLKQHREPAEELHQDDRARSHDGPEDDAEADHGKHDRNKPDYI